MKSRNRAPEISVIIPALNEAKYIMHLFSSLEAQTFRDFEVIVVDGDSTDGTRRLASKMGKVVIEKGKGVGRARNTGARAAKGNIIFFTNADTALSNDLLRKYHDLFRDKSIVAATGPLTPLEDVTPFIRFGYRFASFYLAKLALTIGQPSISGSNFAVRRKEFERARGFDESLITYEDLDLAKRLKRFGRVVFLNDAHVATSSRRIKAWGVTRYILFNAGNVLRYNLYHRSKSDYEPIR